VKKFAVLLIVIPVLFASVSCEKKKEAYIAKVGSTTITQNDFERDFKNLPEFVQKIFEGESGKEKFLDELIKKEILYQEALQKGFDKDPEYQKKVEDFKKFNLISSLLQKEIEAKAKVTDQEIKEHYDRHREDFAPLSKIRASHILVKTEEEAKKIQERLKNGEDFAEIAKKESIDTASGEKGGDIGYFSKGQMVPEFESAAIRLKSGEISEPVKTRFGYHIIKVTDKKVGQAIEFEKVKETLAQRLTAEKQKELFDSYMEGLKKKYKPDINKEALLKLTEEEKKEQK